MSRVLSVLHDSESEKAASLLRDGDVRRFVANRPEHAGRRPCPPKTLLNMVA